MVTDSHKSLLKIYIAHESYKQVLKLFYLCCCVPIVFTWNLFFPEFLIFCFTEERHTEKCPVCLKWHGWVNDDIISIFAWTIPLSYLFFAHPPNKTTLDKAYFNVILQLFQLSSCVLQLLQKKWEMRHLSMTTLLSVLFLSRGRRNKKLFELVSLWHPTPGALEVDALLKLCLSSLQGHSFGLLPQAPDRSGNIHHTFLASFCFIWELLGDTLRCVLNQWA